MLVYIIAAITLDGFIGKSADHRSTDGAHRVNREPTLVDGRSDHRSPAGRRTGGPARLSPTQSDIPV